MFYFTYWLILSRFQPCVSQTRASCVSSTNILSSAHGDLLPASFDNYGGQDLTELELSHYEKTQTKLPAPDTLATPLAMLPTEAEKPKEGENEAISESSSTVVVGAKDKAEADDDEEKDKVDKSSAEAVKAPGSKPGGLEKKEEEKKEGDDKDKDDKKDDKDDKDDKDKDKDDKDDKDKKDVPPPNPDMAGPGPDPVISSTPKGPDEVVHDGFSCDECKVRMTAAYSNSHRTYI